MASISVSPIALALITSGFVLAAVTEAVLLRQSARGVVYLAIISVETLAILSITAVIGEGLNLRQVFGATLVFSGIALVGH